MKVAPDALCTNPWCRGEILVFTFDLRGTGRRVEHMICPKCRPIAAEAYFRMEMRSEQDSDVAELIEAAGRRLEREGRITSGRFNGPARGHGTYGSDGSPVTTAEEPARKCRIVGCDHPATEKSDFCPLHLLEVERRREEMWGAYNRRRRRLWQIAVALIAGACLVFWLLRR